jgi:acetyl-CoA carboxylase biotin carboxyl carrier protein
LTTHQEGAEKAVFMLSEEIDTVREDESVDVNQIRELIRVVESSDVDEVIVEENGSKVTVRKGAAAFAAPMAFAAPAAGAGSPAAAPAEAASGRPASWKEIKALMVGTFYRSPSPGSAAFAEVGDTVEQGSPVCILEAMKLMNEIEMPESGVIREVVAPDGSAVDFGAVLFYYEPAE